MFLNDFRDEPEQALPQDYTAEIFSTLEAKSVSFRYSDIGADTIKNINFKINCGEKIAIVGASGSGKTTIVKLIASLYNPTSGELLFNGFPIHKFDRNVYGKIISIVPQIPIVFKQVYNNLQAPAVALLQEEYYSQLRKIVSVKDKSSFERKSWDENGLFDYRSYSDLFKCHYEKHAVKVEQRG